jgi:hypothetical protein
MVIEPKHKMGLVVVEDSLNISFAVEPEPQS